MLRRLWVAVCVVGAITTLPIAAAAQETTYFQFAISPASGPVGTKVSFTGDVDPSTTVARHVNFAYGLVGSFPEGDCELIVPMDEYRATVDERGHVEGSFVVGSVGGCFMSGADRGPQPARPGTYTIAVPCHACGIGGFRITGPQSLARTGVPVVGWLSLASAFIGVGIACSGAALIGFTVSPRGRRD
jgi:hypothetical protein